MEFHLRLDKFQTKYGRMAKADFVTMFPKPFLVFDLQGTRVNVLDFDAYADSSTATDSTKIAEEGETDRLSQILVAPIEKSDRDKERPQISAGRAPGSDIVVPHPAVSKLHAVFEKDPKHGSYTIQDAGSSFGTTVGGIDLIKGEGALLKSGEEIIFSGYVSATILSPQDFYDFMARAAEGRK
ncbi:MAG: FHA domain-containing protein [Planctomycetota bacterium]|jgi:hypothetical protein